LGGGEVKGALFRTPECKFSVLRFEVWNVGFGVEGLGFKVQGRVRQGASGRGAGVGEV
jgi:hypothetical protein